jgi:hypothetical protein
MTRTAAAFTRPFGTLGFAEGGEVRGPGTGKSDDVLAWLSNGEFVVSAERARKYRKLLDAINGDRKLPGFAEGGVVGVRPGVTRIALSPSASVATVAPQAPYRANEHAMATHAGVVIQRMLVQMPPGVDAVQYLKKSGSQMARETRNAGRRVGVGR